MGASSKERLFFINRQNIFTVNKNEKNHHLTVCHTLCHSNIRGTEITYRVASYNADTDDFVLEAWGEKPAGASAYFFNDYGATTGNRYNQIPRRHQQLLYFCCVIDFSAFFG